MKCYRSFASNFWKASFWKTSPWKMTLIIFCLIASCALATMAAMPSWIQNIETSTALEKLIFRSMPLPGGSVLVRRPPSETVPALTTALETQPQNAELYSLRAMEEEEKEDFTAAEADWKLYLQNSADKGAAQLALADFYDRQMRPEDEINALSALAEMPSPPEQKFAPVSGQRSWWAFERIFEVIQTHALGKEISEVQYKKWLRRYPQESGLYGRYFEYLLSQKNYEAAAELITVYRKNFTEDEVFPVKAQALLDYKRGSVEQGLADYDKAFQPLWPRELVKNYFALLRDTQSLRKFLGKAQRALAANPDDLNAVARIFFYYQQQGNMDAAQRTIRDYRLHKDARKAAWTSQELYTLACLEEDAQNYPEAVRYYYALYSSGGKDDSQEQALAGITYILLTSPQEQVRIGAGELSMYQDIATADTGPGFLNGILSLILNTTTPNEELIQEEKRAVPYFQRARAAELLALFDQKFPKSDQRPQLHAALIQAYAGYGESEAVIRSGREFLSEFPNAGQRTQVALQMADAYASTDHHEEEFAIYDSVLKELAQKAEGIPLGDQAEHNGYEPLARPSADTTQPTEESGDENTAASEGPQDGIQHARKKEDRRFSVGTAPTRSSAGPRSPEYQRVLDLYISRLVSLNDIPRALTVLRGELDRNPNDPGLYEKLVQFLEQNQIGAEQEAVYRRAMQQFPSKSWYHKLARWYLRHERKQDFEALSTEVVKIFSGSDLESYLSGVGGEVPAISLRLNQYANHRFPHNLSFVRHLLDAYQTPEFRDEAAWEALISRHWFESGELRDEFFQYLSRTGKLNAALEALQNESPTQQHDQMAEAGSNPAAARFVAEAELWQSHFEKAAPVLESVAAQYPADIELGTRASSLYRSLAYFDPKNTKTAVEIQQRLLKAGPADRERLARIGDIYADRELFSQAELYWNRIPRTAPGDSSSYLDAATIFWDYYDFDNALRLLREGRRKLNVHGLYSYEMGSIYENQRDYTGAIDEYVKGAIAFAPSQSSPGEDSSSEASEDSSSDDSPSYDSPGNSSPYQSSPSQERLLMLAVRPASKSAVDTATAKAVAGANPSLSAIHLRIAVLEAQERKPDLVNFLTGLVERSDSIETLEDLEAVAKQKSLESVQRHALEREAALTDDPVKRIELRYALISLFEQEKDIPSAQRIVEFLYSENPKIMGVVRATIDFYWRHDLHKQAIEVVLQAAHGSYPELKTQFSFEAARKMTEVKEYEQARTLLLPLMEDSPYNQEYLEAAAETYARAGDNAGLRDFYLQKIAFFRKAEMPDEDRKSRIAALRRGLIPALTTLKDFAGATDQYIEILNRYPEDESLATEAAMYAQHHGRQEQLLKYYSKTMEESPKDVSWPMVLARLQTDYEDYPGAIGSYARAIKISPDRTDLLIGRAGLEERLLRFEEAAADYARVYDLSYRDAQWMAKVAEIRARQGKTDLAVQALKKALIEGHPERATDYFAVAQRLETWGMLQPAEEFSEKGMSIAGNDLLADPQYHCGAQLYARIMTRRREPETAYKALQSRLQVASEEPAGFQQFFKQIFKGGIEATTNEEMRKNMLQTRINNARQGMTAALRDMGATVDLYYTPEEKLQFATSFVEGKRVGMTKEDVEEFWLPLTEAAVLPEQEVRWRYELLSNDPENMGLESRWEEVERRRLKLEELGANLEKLAALNVKPEIRDSYLRKAEDAYQSAEDTGGELRILAQMPGQERYWELLLASDPQRLAQLAGAGNAELRDRVANFVISHADSKLAQQAILARSNGLPPVWKKSYTALAGLYFADPDPQVRAAFVDALGDEPIGQRLKKNADDVSRSQHLAGDTWFYYGSRYGEYLGAMRKGDPEDFLPAMLENTPATASAYFTVAQYYEDAGDLKHAVADYKHVLELAPDEADAHERLALIHWQQNQRDEAISEWKTVLEILHQEAEGSVPGTFLSDYAATVDHIGTRRLFPQFRPQIEQVLNAYVKQNGQYGLQPILRSTFATLNDPTAKAAWILQLYSVASNRSEFLESLVDSGLVPLEEREPIYQRILELHKQTVAKSEGYEKDNAESSLQQWQIAWLEYLLKVKQFERADKELETMSADARKAAEGKLVPIELEIAAQRNENTLDAKLQAYRSDPDHAPALDVLRGAASRFKKEGNNESARKILEFVFTREIETDQLTAANMLGLAEIRIETGDLQGALELMRRLALAVGDPFTHQADAAALLVRMGHPAEAIPFLQELVTAVPWEPAYRIRLAQAQIAAGKDAETAQDVLATIAADARVTYELRSTAATALAGGRPAVDLGSDELKLLSGARTILPAEASHPFYYTARVRAAEKLTKAQEQLPLLRAAVEERPFADPARLPLFRAALGAKNYRLALAVIDPLTGYDFPHTFSQMQRYQYRSQTEDESQDPTAEAGGVENNSVESDSEMETQDTKLEHIPTKEKAEVASGVGLAFEKVGDLSHAIEYLRIAYKLQTVPAQRAQIHHKIEELRSLVRRRMANAARQPVIHDEVEQDHLVRPRLVVKATAPALLHSAGKRREVSR